MSWPFRMCGHSTSIGSFTFMIMSAVAPDCRRHRARSSRRRPCSLRREKPLPCPRPLDQHGVAGGDERLGAGGHERDAILVRLDFLRDADLHGRIYGLLRGAGPRLTYCLLRRRKTRRTNFGDCLSRRSHRPATASRRASETARHTARARGAIHPRARVSSESVICPFNCCLPAASSSAGMPVRPRSAPAPRASHQPPRRRTPATFRRTRRACPRRDGTTEKCGRRTPARALRARAGRAASSSRRRAAC